MNALAFGLTLGRMYHTVLPFFSPFVGHSLSMAAMTIACDMDMQMSSSQETIIEKNQITRSKYSLLD
jgi:hypothetical protein